MYIMLIKYLYNTSNYILNFYYGIKSKIFFLSDIKDIDNKNIYLRLYLYYYLNTFSCYLNNEYKKYINNVCRNLLNKNNNLISLNYTNGKLNRTIVYKNITIENLIKDIRITRDSKDNLFNENEMMMMKKYIVTDIYYTNENESKVSIKQILNKYSDKSKLMINNTVKNILELENIKTNKIYVDFLIKIKKITKEWDLEKNDPHISEIYEFA